ncbi:MAG: hypothetical protein JNG85_06640, partial [Spirochaetaceae bacterium]|nr:hypothetical protein [Spirochaetaceae bacterium]
WQAYTKTLLVPFAETFPADRLPRLGALARRLFGEGWTPGSGPTLLRLATRGAPDEGAKSIPFGTPICFEDGFGEYCAGFARGGARFLAVLTSDAWARSASCQRQHLAASVFRAAETGLPLLRAAGTGATALVGPDGAILASLPPFTADFLLVDLDLPEAAATPYLLLGDLPAGLAGLGALLALALSYAKGGGGSRGLLAAAAARRRRSH